MGKDNYRMIFVSERYKAAVSEVVRKHEKLKMQNKGHPLLKMINEISKNGFCRTEKFNRVYLAGEASVLISLEKYVIDLNVAIIEEAAKAREKINEKKGLAEIVKSQINPDSGLIG